METDIMLDNKNVLTMKLLHYFITEKNYNPIILQGVENEIWLENLDEDCEVVRIVTNYIPVDNLSESVPSIINTLRNNTDNIPIDGIVAVYNDIS